MINPNHRRGHELPDHHQAKSDGRQKMLLADFDLALCEYANGDVVGKHRVGDYEYVLTLEFERSVRNILQNIRRDLHRNKSDKVLIICLRPLNCTTVVRLLDRNLSANDRARVAVVDHDQLTVPLLRSINGSQEVDSGIFRLFRGVNSEEKQIGADVISGCFGNSAIVTQATNQSQEGGDLSARTDGIQANAGRN